MTTPRQYARRTWLRAVCAIALTLAVLALATLFASLCGTLPQ